jgi:hypothetical protein
MTDEEIDLAIAEWREQTSVQSFAHTICKGPAFEKIQALGQQAIPFLLKALRDESGWMGYQFLLRSLTKEDIWQGSALPNGWRAFNVKESAKLWLEWGKNKNLIDNIDPVWDTPPENSNADNLHK